MAKKPSATASKPTINTALLAGIASGAITRITVDDYNALKDHNPQLIEVNGEDVVDGKAAVRITEAGKAMVNGNNEANTQTATTATASQFEIISTATLPPRKRLGRNAGAPDKYPFDKLEIGQSFFVPVSNELPNPAKTLASTIAAKNMKYSEATGEKKQVERIKRGSDHKALLDANGQKVKETVTVDVRKPTRKFAMRNVKAGQDCGGWRATADGVLIARVPLEAAE